MCIYTQVCVYVECGVKCCGSLVPIPISILTSTWEGSRAWQHWGVKVVNISDITIHVTLDQFKSNIATQLLNHATDEALEGDHVQL